jgi:anaerobic selenocysteine-containing dehydrogenase
MSTLVSELGPGEVKSVCPYCGVGCGLVLRAAEGRLTGLRPDPDHPISLGTLCPKGATAHQFVHHADRIVHPLVRQEGRLVETGWDKAYERVVAGLERIREEHGPGALGLVICAHSFDPSLAPKPRLQAVLSSPRERGRGTDGPPT